MRAISLHSVVPVRAKGAETAEMTTQMLFAETCDILMHRANWTKIRLHQDGQEGWVDTKMIATLSDEEYATLAHQNYALVKLPMAYALSVNNGQTIPLSAGTRLYGYKRPTTGQGFGEFSLLGVTFRIEASMVAETKLELNQENLLGTVRFFLNIPYLWGGKNAMGLDCSGFSQTIMALFGQHLRRNASEQAEQGTTVSCLKKAQAGDLVFFSHHSDEGKAGRISHVGILIDSERVVHCSGRVKVEKIDTNGIYSSEYGRYTHQLHSIRRILNSEKKR